MNLNFRLSTAIVALAVALFVVALPAAAQETTGSISGQVTDPSGGAVPNTKIEVGGGSLPRPITVTTDGTGNYRVASLPVGLYTVTATAQGFSNMKKTDVPVVMGRNAEINFKMEVGRVTESVVVAADAVMVDTASSSSQVAVDRSFFDLIPKGRGFQDLINLAPGARNEGKAGGFEVDGSSGSENIFYLDGMEVTNMQTGVLDSKNQLPVDLVQQVQVKNGVMDAQYGGAMGGVVSASIRSGSNDWHGQVGFYFNNNSMSARPNPTLEFDPNDATHSKTRYFQNSMDNYKTWNPVFDIGGPIVKNKLFFFSGYAPRMTTTTRTVTFLSNNQTGTFDSKYRQHYLSNKLDFAPFSKLRMNSSWIWNPNYTKGNLPARQGTDNPALNWKDKGQYTGSQTISGQVDYLATNKLVISFRGGYNWNNDINRYDVNSVTAVYYSNANTAFSDIPADLRRTAAGWYQGGAFGRQDFNYFKRVNLNLDGSYLANWKGQHNLKFGWQTNRLSNSVQNLSYPNGYYRYYWGQSYTCVTSQCAGKQTGKYGYYRWYTYGDFGDASSTNNSIFFQDSWRVNKNLTLNLGLRTEREFLPSFKQGERAAAPPVEFGFGQKMSPRIGGAWDPKGDGKMKFYASWGYFYDLMKYEMPRGSFGGAIYLTAYYALDDPNWVKTTQGYPADPKKLPGKMFEIVDWRIPSNSTNPADNTIDKDLKPMKQRMFDLGYDYSINPTLVATLRYTNRRLIRTIEDVGTLGPAGEVYYIANPGEGLTANPKTWDPGFPTTPKAKRDYDALEIRLDKRFSKSYQFAASYTFSKLRGNYSGLASSDENGRTSPNVNRYFDLPWLGYNEQGKMAEGPLGTDRPHTVKLFGSYSLKSKVGTTTFSPTAFLYSGTPLTSEINIISSTPAYPYNRGDLGRTPFYHGFDFNALHDFTPIKAKEQMKIRFEFTVFNLFNNRTVMDKNANLLHPDDGQLTFAHDADVFKGFNTKALMKAQGNRDNPLFGLANSWQGPRSARIQLSFIF